VLVTGAGGEIGHALIERLSDAGARVLALDLRPLPEALARRCAATSVADITDPAALAAFVGDTGLDSVFHLAALLSTASERDPVRATAVNVGGTVNLLEVAAQASRRTGRAVGFFFPSSIAVYGLPSVAAKAEAGRVSEDEHLDPITAYGVHKRTCEQIGRYWARNYRMLDPDRAPGVDFRGLRFPGLLSADTAPTGGTSDYGPEMIQSAASGNPYAAFVRPDTAIPFMAMPDAINAIFALMAAPRADLRREVYNIGAFAPTAQDFADLVARDFPGSQVSFDVHPLRQRIVDSWPRDVDDSAARADWGFRPSWTLERAFTDYLVPGVLRRIRPR
jgi:nucleoside-diphosphate-sugar epimerase